VEDVYAVSMSELVASTLIRLRARRCQRVVGPSEQACLSSSPSRSGSKSEQTEQEEAVEEPKRTHTYPPRSDSSRSIPLREPTACFLGGSTCLSTGYPRREI